MDKYGIQINKTSRNTVLFMTNIGTTRSSVAYLIEVLARIAAELDARDEDSSPAERALLARRVHSLTEDLPALPDFSRFHDRFRPDPDGPTPEGDTRAGLFPGLRRRDLRVPAAPGPHHRRRDGGRARDRLGRPSSSPTRRASRSWSRGRC